MIKLLSPDLINKIAAGEVVDRPASVVKELTENAVDAGANAIELQLEQGGIKLIKITDNGKGMNQQDAKLCLLRHATSKLASVEDLFNIRSLGFRGEALASIAAVSQFELITKSDSEETGWKVFLDEQLQSRAEPSPANQGTMVAVKNIFYNVPARQKFLKTPGTEFAHILKYLQQFSIIHPELEIKLEHNGKTIFHVHASEWIKRVEKILGKEFSDKLIQLSESNREEIRVSGFIAKPELVHATHKNQYLFVNQRPIYDALVSRAVLEAYDTLVPRGYFPAFVIKIDIDPSLVDVNVHPRKSEVKFKDSGQVISTIKSVVSNSLRNTDLTQIHSLRTGALSSHIQKIKPTTLTSTQQSSPGVSGASVSSPKAIRQTLDFGSSFSGGIEDIKNTPLIEKNWRIVGQIHHSYILVETPDGLQLLDQHAVSEISNYHKLMNQRNNGEVCSQQLLLPLQLDISAEEVSLIEEQQVMLKRLGWEIDQLSPTSIQINSLPEILKVDYLQSNVQDLLTQIKEVETADMSSRELAIIKFEACRGAVMFGDPLSFPEMESLLNKWLQVPNNASCEHGRPAAAKITIDEMQKYFHR